MDGKNLEKVEDNVVFTVFYEVKGNCCFKPATSSHLSIALFNIFLS